jgi:adenine-specific DNA glycosylase
MVFGQMDIAVDTHIFRVANRTGLAPGKNPREVEDGLVANTPDEFKKNAHHWLLLHGRYVCTARKPACPKCIINDLCEYPDKTPASQLRKSDAPVAHEGAPPAIASRIEKALKRKAKGRLGGKAVGVRTKRPAAGSKAQHAGAASVGRAARGRKTSSRR